MFNLIIDYLTIVLPFYRASEDAGIWMIDRQAMRDYLESFLVTKGSL